MNRRTFVHSLTASLAGASLLPRLRPTATRLDRVGLELYAVRDAMGRDPEGTLAAIRAMGYTDVELLWSMNNFGRTPRQVRATLDQVGLRAPSAHMTPETILKDWDKSLETAKLLGHEYLIVPSFSTDASNTLDKWRYWADQFNSAGAVARKSDIWLAFHNEADHIKPIDGIIPYDLFVDRTDPSAVRLQLDVGNMVMGGGDPFHYLDKYRNRYWSFHIKDIVPDRSKDTELGKGTVDIGRILAAVPDVNRKPVYVEQETWADSMASARMNYQYLAALDF
jgi:sugar phosphate isomerase/epimerase